MGRQVALHFWFFQDLNIGSRRDRLDGPSPALKRHATAATRCFQMTTELSDLPSLGPTSAALLVEVGIEDYSALAEHGP